MRLVQGCRLEDRWYTGHATTDARADASGERALTDVETDDLVPLLAQCAGQRLAEMTRASGDQYAHDPRQHPTHVVALQPNPILSIRSGIDRVRCARKPYWSFGK